MLNGLSQRHDMRVIGMSDSAYRYRPAPDRSQIPRERIVAVAQGDRRYISGLIYLKLRQAS